VTEPTANEVLDHLDAAVIDLGKHKDQIEVADVRRLIAAERPPTYVPRQRAEIDIKEVSNG